MGEFLLSIIGMNIDGFVVYTNRVKHAKYEIGEFVKLYYPHKTQRGTRAKAYYRIFGKTYAVKQIHQLLETRDPNIIDLDGFTSYQRQLQDAEIHSMVSSGADPARVAKKMKWATVAVTAAVERHLARTNARTAQMMREKDEKATQASVQRILDSWEQDYR